MTVSIKLQALVYDILPSTTAVFSYVIGSRKLSANEQFLLLVSNSSKFVTNNSEYIRRLFNVAMLFTPAQIKLKSFKLRRNSLFFFFFLPGVDASHVYVRAWALGCFHSLISTHTPSSAFRHPPPNSARFSYAIEGVLFISAQLSSDAVSALRKVPVLI